VQGKPHQKVRGMSPTAIGVVAIFLVIGTGFGWHWQKSYAAHGDVKVAKTRLRGGRKTRLRSGIYAVLIGIGIVLAFADFVRKG
jgi:hypothetical protein